MNPVQRCQQPAVSNSLAGNTRQKSGGKGRELLVDWSGIKAVFKPKLQLKMLSLAAQSWRQLFLTAISFFSRLQLVNSLQQWCCQAFRKGHNWLYEFGCHVYPDISIYQPNSSDILISNLGTQLTKMQWQWFYFKIRADKEKMKLFLVLTLIQQHND